MGDDVGSVLHLHQEAAAIGLDAIAGTDSREEAVRRPHARVACRHVAPQLRHDDRQSHLA